jgi:hypothetical protein
MSNLIELEDELLPSTAAGSPDDEQDDGDAASGGAYRAAASSLSQTARRKRRRRIAAAAARPVSRREVRARATALAAQRPIRYRVPGSIPLIGATGTMNAWASTLTMLLSWRDRASLGVDDVLGRLGPRFLDASIATRDWLSRTSPTSWRSRAWRRTRRPASPPRTSRCCCASAARCG